MEFGGFVERIEYPSYGGPEQMRIASFSPPFPGNDDILVRVCAASINPVDWQIRQGKLKLLTGSSFPRAMGKDFAGIIVQVGSSVVDWQVGDAVVGCVPWKRAGAFATMALVRAEDIVKKPENLSFIQAAALPTVGLTAWHGLVKEAALKSGQSILLNGAAGGVGRAAIQIAQSTGADIVARVGARSFEQIKALGVQHVLDYREPLPSALAHHFDVVFDSHGSMTSREIDRLLKPNGSAVDITIKLPKLLRSIFLRRQKLAFGTVDKQTLLAVVDLASTGKLDIGIGALVPLSGAIALISQLEAGKSIDGKAVIDFD